MAEAASSSSALGRLWEFIRFVATASVAALTNLIGRFVLDVWLPFEMAVVLAYLAGMVVAFVMFQRLIFGDPGSPVGRQVYRFCLVNAMNLGLTVAVASLLARLVFPAIGMSWRPDDVAHVIAVAAPALPAYLGHKHYTYKA
ncbi:MAG: GtrA family protein [Maricaulaceae bacterium]|jgi:putative flippase GtrA